MLDAIFERRYQAERRAVLQAEGLTVYLVAKQRLGMNGAVYIEAYVIFFVGRDEADVGRKVGRRIAYIFDGLAVATG